MKITLLTEYLTGIGGAERVFADLANMYPNARLKSIIANDQSLGWLKARKIYESSFGANLPQFLKKRRQWLLPFLPTVVERMRFDDSNLVFSLSHSFAKGILVPQDTTHVCYCTSPTRYLWDWKDRYLDEKRINPIFKPFLKRLFYDLRMWDFAAAQRVDKFIAISKTVQQRIKKFYRHDSEVIYPGIDLKRFTNVEAQCFASLRRNRYWLIVSRLSPYKNIEIAIQVFNKMQLPLVIVGKGEQEKHLKKIADKNYIKFIGEVGEERLVKLYEKAYAYIVPGVEDFGLAAVEAMACGKPVLAFGQGGLTEIIQEGINGEFFGDDSCVPVVADGVRRIRENYKSYDPMEIRKSVERFGMGRFEREVRGYVGGLAG